MIDLDAIVANVTGQKPARSRPASKQLDLTELIAEVVGRPKRLSALPDPTELPATRKGRQEWLEQIEALLPTGWRMGGSQGALDAWVNATEGRRTGSVEYLARISLYQRGGEILQIDVVAVPWWESRWGRGKWYGGERLIEHGHLTDARGRRLSTWEGYPYAVVFARSERSPEGMPSGWRTRHIWVAHRVRDALKVALDQVMFPVSQGEASTKRWPLEPRYPW